MASWLVVGACALFSDLVHPALRPDDDAAHATVIVALWLAYALVLAATALPGPRPLTVVRVGVPAGGLAVSYAQTAAVETVTVIAWGTALIGAIAVMQPAYAEAQVNAASYGDERRFLLRPPGPVLVAMIVPMWAVSVAGVAAGPLLLAGQGWTAGLLGTAVGLPAAAFAAHTLYRLARRWLVFVPNGLVVHDHLAVAEPLPLHRRGIAAIGPARADTSADDLTAQAFGMALEVQLVEPVTVAAVTGRNRSEPRSMTALLVSPSRPAAVMALARRRGITLA